MSEIQIQRVPPDRVEAAWAAWAGALLKPAIERDTEAKDVKALLVSGQYELAAVSAPEGYGAVVSELCTIDGVQCLWLNYIAGSSDVGPRGFIRAVRKIMAEYEKLARNAGCEEIRIGGRDWSRIFPEFERFDDKPNRLRKRLVNGR